MCTCLQQAGYSVIEAASGPEALALFQQNETSIALVVSDVQMPGMSGVDLVECLLERRPELPIIFVSGYSDVLPQRMRGFSFVPKPFRLDELICGVEGALSSTNPGGREPAWKA